MWDSEISRKRLIQNIALLSTVNQIPEKPKENHLVSENHDTHRLTLERENDIVGNLAFQSATTDDNLKIMAVCTSVAKQLRFVSLLTRGIWQKS